MIKDTMLIPSTLKANYYLSGVKEKRCFLILHGYQHSARKILLDLEGAFNEEDFLIAPDAPYPVPRKPDNFNRLGFAWCFEAPNTQLGHISALSSTEFLASFIKKQGLTSIPMTIIAFSQGGMVGFKLADYFTNIDSLVGFSTIPLHHKITTANKLSILGIHGTADPIFPIEKSKEQYEELKRLGHSTQFYSILNMGHFINEEAKNILKDFLKTL